MTTLLSKNPATGEILQELTATAFGELPGLMLRARAAQQPWAARSPEDRCRYLIRAREVLIRRSDELAVKISLENGKPPFEALSNEILPCVDMLGHFAKRIPRLLQDQTIPMTLMKHRASVLNYWPMGVIAVISPWNYPFMLPFAEILMALGVGNSVLFKPSEVTPRTGLLIQDVFTEAGIPHDVLQTLLGDGLLGAGLIEQKPDKIFFTGSVDTGKKVMASAAKHLIPVNLELGGKDAMIVLPDADLDYATSAALWGGFSNSGQVCSSTERLLLHREIEKPFLDLLQKKIGQLRQGNPSASAVDLGVITLEKQKDVYSRQLADAQERGARILCGGSFSENHRWLKPTLVTGDRIEESSIYNDETFGPVLAVTTFSTDEEAVQKANASRYGLLASVIAGDVTRAEGVARQLEVGTVLINEVTYTAGLGETPWGGIKESGIGRSHSDIGVYEFVHVRHIHRPKRLTPLFKSPWWFPYTPAQHDVFRSFIRLFHANWLKKLAAIPQLVSSFFRFLLKEPRL